MEYIYDIVLNFHKVYYAFYEWNINDKITHIKKIPFIKVDTDTYIRIKNNNITVDRELVEMLKNKTITYNNGTYTMCLLCNGKECLAVKLNDSGFITSKSSLILDEEDEVIEESYNLDITKVNIINEEVKPERRLGRSFIERQDKAKRVLIDLDEDKDKYILKYLYYECYLVDRSSNIKNKLLQNINNEEILNKLYNSLVNLNKIKNTI